MIDWLDLGCYFTYYPLEYTNYLHNNRTHCFRVESVPEHSDTETQIQVCYLGRAVWKHAAQEAFSCFTVISLLPL